MDKIYFVKRSVVGVLDFEKKLFYINFVLVFKMIVVICIINFKV